MQIRGFDKSSIEVKNNRDAVKVEIFVPGSRAYCNLPIERAEKLLKELRKAINCARNCQNFNTEER